jgi:hypothetical protein
MIGTPESLIAAAADDLFRLRFYADHRVLDATPALRRKGPSGHSPHSSGAALLAKERAELAAINPRQNPRTGVSS